jgi:hypothetical protein
MRLPNPMLARPASLPRSQPNPEDAVLANALSVVEVEFELAAN